MEEFKIIDKRDDIDQAAKEKRLAVIDETLKAIFVDGKHSGFFVQADEAREVKLAGMKETAKLLGGGVIKVRFFEEDARVEYDVKQDKYIVYRNNMPTFEAWNGNICADSTALIES